MINGGFLFFHKSVTINGARGVQKLSMMSMVLVMSMVPMMFMVFVMSMTDGLMVEFLMMMPGGKISENKAGYTATPVACGWAGALIEVTPSFGQEQ